MAEVKYSAGARADFERLFELLVTENPRGAMAAVDAITSGIEILARHPLIGRPAEHGFHELVISRGNSGYLALYEYLPVEDLVLVHALRRQREAGFQNPR